MLHDPHCADDVPARGVIDRANKRLAETVRRYTRRIDAAVFASLDQDAVCLGPVEGTVASLPRSEQEVVGPRHGAWRGEVIPNRLFHLLVLFLAQAWDWFDL